MTVGRAVQRAVGRAEGLLCVKQIVSGVAVLPLYGSIGGMPVLWCVHPVRWGDKSRLLIIAAHILFIKEIAVFVPHARIGVGGAAKGLGRGGHL